MTSKLEIIADSLETNDGLFVIENKSHSRKENNIVRKIEYYVAPLNGIDKYDVKKMNELIDGLIPELDPDSRIPYIANIHAADIGYGRLYFEEEIDYGNIKMKRHIGINVYPSSELAEYYSKN